MKYIYILLLAFLILSIGCSKPVTLSFDGTNFYQVVNGQQVAFDGKDWYQLRSAEQPLGTMNGHDYVVSEAWSKLGENTSHVITYSRDLATKNNTNLTPRFVRN